jgi:hypothetical protein
MTSNVTKILKKRENALLENNSNVIFQLFYLLRLALSDLLLGFYSNKIEKSSLSCLKSIKKHFCIKVTSGF